MSVPPRKRTRDPDRATKVLAAARRLFYERGFHGVSVDEIGEAAGSTGAALYRSFVGKEEVLATLFDEAQDRYLVGIPEATDDPIADLDALVDRHLRITLDQRELGSIWAHEQRALGPEHARRIDRRSRQYLERWVDVLERALPQRDRAELLIAANAVIGMTTSLVLRPGREIGEREREITHRLAVDGLLGLGREGA